MLLFCWLIIVLFGRVVLVEVVFVNVMVDLFVSRMVVFSISRGCVSWVWVLMIIVFFWLFYNDIKEG